MSKKFKKEWAKMQKVGEGIFVPHEDIITEVMSHSGVDALTAERIFNLVLMHLGQL